MPFLLPFISFLFCLKTRTAPHILAEKKRHIQIASLLVSLLLIHYRDTRISEASLTKSYWWLTTSQRRCGKNNLQREEDDADSCSYLKDKARVGCRDHQRGGDKKKRTRLNTHCTRKIGHFLFTNLESKKHRLPQEDQADKRMVEQHSMVWESGGEAWTCGWVVLEHNRWC